MGSDVCYASICFVPLETSGPRFFGFAELLAALALMVLAWTIADVRYRFRVRITPLPLQGITFAVVAVVGVLTLLTDLWRAEGWLVPSGRLVTPAAWQALLGGTFLVTFLMWAWYAFIRPPTYGKRNIRRFSQVLYRYILKGSPAELAIIADELAGSIKSLVRYAPEKHELEEPRSRNEKVPARKLSPVAAYANDILSLIGDKRFCRVIVESSSITAYAVFREMITTKKFGINVSTFARNITNEALTNRDSFIFHEEEGYDSGLIGYHKPLTQAMYSNFELVETVGSLLDPQHVGQREWDARQWEAYCRIVLMTFRSYVDTAFWRHSYALYRAKGYIEHAAMDIYKLNGVESPDYDREPIDRLQAIVQFISEAVEILDKKGVPAGLRLRVREKHAPDDTFYDHIADMIFEAMFSASSVRSPSGRCWWVQHNTVWSHLFNFSSLNGAAGKVIKFKARRLVYNEIADMKRFPNFKGARILGFCLNVM